MKLDAPEGDDGSEIHFALAYGAVTRLEDAGTVLEDLKERADEVGVVGGVEPHVINDLGRRHDVIIDFYAVPPGTKSGLEGAKVTDPERDVRHVFVGTGRRDEVVAERVGWEYHDFETVAHEEGWSVTD